MKLNKAVLVFGASIGIAALLVVSTIVSGWALSILWLWFMVPFGLPALNIPQAIGIAMVINYVTYHYTKDADYDWTHAVATAIMRPFVALGVGYIVTLFL